jgi:menaquinone-dependent protoporphyrinogen oxidase
MATVLVCFGTTEGQTAKIAEVIARTLDERGHAAETADVKDIGDTVPDRCAAVVLGASIHRGKHDKHVVEFARRNRQTLERLPSCFFSVSLAAHGDPEEAEGYIAQFEEETQWHPDKVAMFGGALLYTQYGFIKRRIMRRIAQEKPGTLGTDTSHDDVYTEWDAVTRFAENFADQLESTPA